MTCILTAGSFALAAAKCQTLHLNKESTFIYAEFLGGCIMKGSPAI